MHLAVQQVMQLADQFRFAVGFVGAFAALFAAFVVLEPNLGVSE